MIDVLSYGLRTVLIYFFAYFAGRVLTKKAIAQMTAYEILGIMILGTVAAEPLVTKITTKALFGSGLIVALTLFSSRLALVNKLTPIMEHTPTIVIKNGDVDMQALKGTMVTLNELYGYLRNKGYTKISDVEFGIVEPNGEFSIIPKSQFRPLQPNDLNVPTKYEGLTLPLIMDGALIERNLAHVKLTDEWLRTELLKQGYTEFEHVAIAELDTQGTLHVILK